VYVVHKFVSVAKIRSYDLNELMALLRVVAAAAQGSYFYSRTEDSRSKNPMEF
jgi:hypothetical protein